VDSLFGLTCVFAYTHKLNSTQGAMEKPMKWIAVILCSGLAIVLVACADAARTTNSPAPSAAQTPAGAVPAGTPDELAAARTNYQKNCLGCHGETGEGGLVKVDEKQLKVPSFKAAHAMRHSDEDFTEQISEGGDGMPTFKEKLNPAEIADLVKLIRRDFQGR
jgi:mono/diheme cytochrome c family protein